MSTLSYSVLAIQNALIDAACIADFRVDHIEADDYRPEAIRVAYTLNDRRAAIAESEALFARLESEHGIVVADSGSSGDHLYIVWTLAE
jgi:hypothetical protein